MVHGVSLPNAEKINGINSCLLKGCSKDFTSKNVGLLSLVAETKTFYTIYILEKWNVQQYSSIHYITVQALLSLDSYSVMMIYKFWLILWILTSDYKTVIYLVQYTWVLVWLGMILILCHGNMCHHMEGNLEWHDMTCILAGDVKSRPPLWVKCANHRATNLYVYVYGLTYKLLYISLINLWSIKCEL